jgi:hypothetical protein
MSAEYSPAAALCRSDRRLAVNAEALCWLNKLRKSPVFEGYGLQAVGKLLQTGTALQAAEEVSIRRARLLSVPNRLGLMRALAPEGAIFLVSTTFSAACEVL